MQNRSTLSSSTDVTIHATATCTSIVVQRWRCDVCQEASFEDFHEACRHEQSCRGGPPKATQSQLPSSQTTTSSTTTTSIPQPGQTRRQAAKRISDVYVSPEPSPQSTMTVTVKKRPHPKSQTRKSSNQATHSFFAPRKNAKRSTTTKAPTNNAKEKKATPTPASTQSSQPLTPESQNQSDDDSYNAVDVQLVRVKPAKKLSRAETIEEKVAILTAMVNDDMKKPALAGIFTNKSMQQLMSEQRQAEFQAQRRLERQRELERKQKRATSHPPDISTFIAKSTTKPMVLPVHCRQPVAPRISTHVGSIYPIPILPRDEVSFWMEIPSLRHQTHTKTRQQEQTQPFSEKIISSPNVLDAQDNHNDMLREAFANIIVPSKARKDTILWSHKYGHQHNIDSVIGQTTQQAVGTLKQWIEDWCFARQRSLTRMKVRQEQLKKKKTNKLVYKQDRDEDSWDEDQLTNVYLLTGPPASGKTGLVHAVAKNCQCSVLEINTTMARSASALKHSIQEATQSCSTSDLFRQQASFQSTIQSQSLQDSDEESSSQKSRPTTSLTVILIDEVDLIYEGEGDAGFWNALISLTKTARCPIFLTATSLPQNLASIKYKHLALTRPSPMECSNKLLQVCREEGIVMSSGLTPDAIRQQLAWIANVYQCDLRKLLLQLQLYHATGMVTKEIEEKDKEVTQPTLHLSPMNVIQMPELHSVVPHCVPAERYSIVTIYGANFGLLSTRDVAVRLGCETCPARIVDRETIIVLCPPLRHDTGPSSRILDLSICSSIFGTLHGIAIKGEQLEDGSLLQGSKYVHVEYMIMDDDEQEDEECELDGSNHSSSKSIASLPTPEQGLVLWNKTLQETGWMEEPDLLPPAVEKNMLLFQQQLDNLAEEAHYASDAAYLEEAQRGYPYLSGACRGFGFDLTEEGGSAGGGKLTLNDKCRPPSEDRLFTLGWKDNCFFHGVAETYMTLPTTGQERRSLYEMMETTRGKAMSTPDLGLIAPTDKIEDALDDLDDIVRRDYNVSEEDMFCPQPLPILLESLPQILRASRHSDFWNRNGTSNQLLQQRQLKRTTFFQSCTSTLFDQNIHPLKGKLRSISRELLQLNGKFDVIMATEFFPMLCRIGALEENFEALERQRDKPVDDSCRRTTRRHARNMRRHYFDSLSRKLEWDEASMSSSDLGQAMAKTLLTYKAVAT